MARSQSRGKKKPRPKKKARSSSNNKSTVPTVPATPCSDESKELQNIYGGGSRPTPPKSAKQIRSLLNAHKKRVDALRKGGAPPMGVGEEKVDDMLARAGVTEADVRRDREAWERLQQQRENERYQAELANRRMQDAVNREHQAQMERQRLAAQKRDLEQQLARADMERREKEAALKKEQSHRHLYEAVLNPWHRADPIESAARYLEKERMKKEVKQELAEERKWRKATAALNRGPKLSRSRGRSRSKSRNRNSSKKSRSKSKGNKRSSSKSNNRSRSRSRGRGKSTQKFDD